MGVNQSCGSCKAVLDTHLKNANTDSQYSTYFECGDDDWIDTIVDKLENSPNDMPQIRHNNHQSMKASIPKIQLFDFTDDTNHSTIGDNDNNPSNLPLIDSGSPLLLPTTPRPIDLTALNELLEVRTLSKPSTPTAIHHKKNSTLSNISEISNLCIEYDAIQSNDDNGDNDADSDSPIPTFLKQRSKSVDLSNARQKNRNNNKSVDISATQSLPKVTPKIDRRYSEIQIGSNLNRYPMTPVATNDRRYCYPPMTPPVKRYRRYSLAVPMPSSSSSSHNRYRNVTRKLPSTPQLHCRQSFPQFHNNRRPQLTELSRSHSNLRKKQRRHSNLLRCDTLGDWSETDLTKLESDISSQMEYLEEQIVTTHSKTYT